MLFQKLSRLVDVRHVLSQNQRKRYATVRMETKEDIVLHHSLTKMNFAGSNAEGYARYHVHSLGWPGIGYHFVIEKDGVVKWCHSINVSSYHVGKFNTQAVGICLSGDFRTEQPTSSQKAALVSLVAALKRDLPNYKRTLGHSDYPGYEKKACPVFDWRAILNRDVPAKDIQKETHVIKKGDTLWRLAILNGTTVDRLLSLNPSVDPYRLQIGQKIYLSGD